MPNARIDGQIGGLPVGLPVCLPAGLPAGLPVCLPSGLPAGLFAGLFAGLLAGLLTAGAAVAQQAPPRIVQLQGDVRVNGASKSWYWPGNTFHSVVPPRLFIQSLYCSHSWAGVLSSFSANTNSRGIGINLSTEILSKHPG